MVMKGGLLLGPWYASSHLGLDFSTRDKYTAESGSAFAESKWGRGSRGPFPVTRFAVCSGGWNLAGKQDPPPEPGLKPGQNRSNAGQMARLEAGVEGRNGLQLQRQLSEVLEPRGTIHSYTLNNVYDIWLSSLFEGSPTRRPTLAH